MKGLSLIAAVLCCGCVRSDHCSAFRLCPRRGFIIFRRWATFHHPLVSLISRLSGLAA
jgi:hypothetical protein